APGVTNYLVTKEASGGTYKDNYSIEMDTGTGDLFVESTTNNGAGMIDATTPYASLLDGHWHYVVGTSDNTNLRLYVDGVLKDTQALGGNVDNPAQPVRIGDSNWDPTWAFKGDIDEVRISNVARSTAQVAGYYRQRLPHFLTLWDSDTTDVGIAQATCAN